ncbi:MAG TPA: hypothetical protein VMU61_01410 [Candidatus Aquilonibacter sp.]|nr:hypothetical protein [Candidatus Aquilonibacter sp.]
MSHFLRARVVLLLVGVLAGAACSPQKTKAPDPAAVLQSVPAANPAKYQSISDMRKWRNPYLLVRADGIALLDPADSAEIVLKPEEVLATLARLPSSAWPYGRVVAVAESGAASSESDHVAIRRNKGIVGGVLAGAHVAVDWVPSG